MVHHWLNWNAETDNVIISNHFSLCIGSCTSDQCFSVDQKLSAGEPAANVLDGSRLTLIKFSSFISIRYVRKATAVLIKYRTQNNTKTREIELGSPEKAEELFDHLSQYLSSSMDKCSGDHSRNYGLMLVICSVFFSAVFLYAYFNKFRLLAYLLPLFCVLGVLAYVIRMENIQRRITRWTSEPDRQSLKIPALRAMGACLIFSTLSLCVSPFFADRYGHKALYSAAQGNALQVADIAGFLDRGSSVNYLHTDNTSALWWSIKNQAHPVSLKLIELGADVRVKQGGLLEHALANEANEVVLRAMLDRGALESAELMGKFDTKHHLKTNTNNFARVFRRYRDSL